MIIDILVSNQSYRMGGLPAEGAFGVRSTGTFGEGGVSPLYFQNESEIEKKKPNLDTSNWGFAEGTYGEGSGSPFMYLL